MNKTMFKSIALKFSTIIFYLIAIFLFTGFSYEAKALSGMIFILLLSVFLITDFTFHSIKFRKLTTCLITGLTFMYLLVFIHSKDILNLFFEELPKFNNFITVYIASGCILSMLLAYYLYNTKKDIKHPIIQFVYLILPIISLIAFVYTRSTSFVDNNLLFMMYPNEAPATILYSRGELPLLYPLSFVSIVCLLLIKNKPLLITYIAQITAIFTLIALYLSINTPIEAIYRFLSISAYLSIAFLSTILILDLKRSYFVKIKSFIKK